ncbi:MAG TPA: ferric reductase-like transmembrane domain-containing protein [Roseiarcus sp.]|jgi:predicted ferric reductase|nr:ferric reductase-like transmembrane domain-containing protein [Roseiarcus sp.]
MRLHYSMRGAVWVFIYLLFILAPLFALLTGSFAPTPRDFWGEFAVAIGYSGLAMMGLQFGLTARFRYVTEPWGEDVIYHFHRRISLVAIALVVLHVVILFALRPQRLGMLNFLEASWRASFGALSIYALIALVAMAVWRTKLRISYETWHLSHIVLAVVAIAAGLLHMVGFGRYLVDPWKQALWVGLATSGSGFSCTYASSSRCSCCADPTGSRKCARNAATPGRS